MKKTLSILALLLVASIAGAADKVWQIPATITTSAVNRVASCPGFVGRLESVTLYGNTGGATGVITIAIVDGLDSAAITIATNAPLASGQKTWRPRVVTPAVGGASALSVSTNTGDMYLISGETIRATMASVTGTNRVITLRAKFEE